jgi:hypothetical protein
VLRWRRRLPLRGWDRRRARLLQRSLLMAVAQLKSHLQRHLTDGGAAAGRQDWDDQRLSTLCDHDPQGHARRAEQSVWPKHGFVDLQQYLFVRLGDSKRHFIVDVCGKSRPGLGGAGLAGGRLGVGCVDADVNLALAAWNNPYLANWGEQWWHDAN